MRLAASLFLLASLVVTSASSAAPVQYDFRSGIVTITASVGGSLIGGPVTADLDGIQVTVDETAGQLVSLALSAPGPIDLAFSPAFMGQTSMSISDLEISGGPAPLVPVMGTPLLTFVMPGTVSAQVGLSGMAAVPISSSSFVNGNIIISPSLNQLTLSGFSLGPFSPPGLGGAPVLLKADFQFAGSPIPEPGAALLFAIGFATVAARRSRT